MKLNWLLGWICASIMRLISSSSDDSCLYFFEISSNYVEIELVFAFLAISRIYLDKLKKLM